MSPFLSRLLNRLPLAGGLFPNAYHVAKREYNVRVRNRTFAILTIGLAVVGLGLTLLPLGVNLIGGQKPVKVGVYSTASDLSVDPATTVQSVLNSLAGGGSGTTGGSGGVDRTALLGHRGDRPGRRPGRGTAGQARRAPDHLAHLQRRPGLRCVHARPRPTTRTWPSCGRPRPRSPSRIGWSARVSRRRTAGGSSRPPTSPRPPPTRTRPARTRRTTSRPTSSPTCS